VEPDKDSSSDSAGVEGDEGVRMTRYWEVLVDGLWEEVKLTDGKL
jgi:hypothetical protein